MVMIVDSAVAADPLVIYRLVVKMDAIDESGDAALVPTRLELSRPHKRLALICR